MDRFGTCCEQSENRIRKVEKQYTLKVDSYVKLEEDATLKELGRGWVRLNEFAQNWPMGLMLDFIMCLFDMISRLVCPPHLLHSKAN